VKSKKKPCIRFNSMEFQLQTVYLIYTWLIVYAILNLAYPKRHMI